MRAISSAIILALLVVIYIPTAPAENVKPADVLTKMAEAYEKADKIAFKTVVIMPMAQLSPQMAGQTLIMPMDMKMERPNKFFMESKYGLMGSQNHMTSVSDGKTMYIHMAVSHPQMGEMINGYQKMDAPKDMSMQGMSGPMGDMSNETNLMGMMMNKNSKEAIKTLAQQAKMLPEEDINNNMCHHMEVVAATGVKMQVWIDKKNHLLRQSSMDMYDIMKLMQEATGQSNPMMSNIKPGDMIITQEYRDYNLKPTFGPDTFKFTPPPGAREMDFANMMGGGGGSSSGAAKPTRRMQ